MISAPAGMQSILEAIGSLPDAEIDLADAALQLARIDAPGADWQAGRTHLSEIARDAARYAARDPERDLMARANALSDLLCDHHDYSGDIEDYDNLDNANLIHVMQRRRGLPVALGIIWLHAAQAAGWPAYGVDLPGHFVIALAEEGTQRRLVLDVFDGGAAMDAKAIKRLIRRMVGANVELDAETLQPMTNRTILIRLQSNIRLRRTQSGDLEGALACTLNTLLIAPRAAPLWYEAASLQQKLDQVGAALHSYGQFLALSPPGPIAAQARAAMDDLRTRLN